jgi:hypothetical protein
MPGGLGNWLAAVRELAKNTGIAGGGYLGVKRPDNLTMGSPASELGGDSDEGPQTPHGFGMSQSETTQAEYQSVVGSNPPSFNGDLLRPVANVSWSAATNYCGKLTARERWAKRLPAGHVCRLPTEADLRDRERRPAGSAVRSKPPWPVDRPLCPGIPDYYCLQHNLWLTPHYPGPPPPPAAQHIGLDSWRWEVY